MNKADNTDVVSFFVPVEIEKGVVDKDGKKKMRVKGIASTPSRDTDGENLNPAGFNINTLVSKGHLTWAHAAKENPLANIGEPTLARITNDNKLYIEGELYEDNPLARSVYQLAEILEKNSSTRRLGFSIEGKVLEKDKLNPKKILKADIYGVTLCTMPKNPDTLVEIMKGEQSGVVRYDIETDEQGNQYLIKAIDSELGLTATMDTDFNIVIEKALQAGEITGTDTTDKTDVSGAALKEEDVEGNTEKLTDSESHDKKKKKKKVDEILSKGEIYQHIFTNFSPCNTEVAKGIYSLTQQVAFMTKQTSEITMGDIEKAKHILDLVKGETSNPQELISTTAMNLKEKGLNKEATETALKEQGFDDESIEKALESVFKEGDDNLNKGDNTELNKGLDQNTIPVEVQSIIDSEINQDALIANATSVYGKMIEKGVKEDVAVAFLKKSYSDDVVIEVIKTKEAPIDNKTQNTENVELLIEKGLKTFGDSITNTISEMMSGLRNEIEEMKTEFDSKLTELESQPLQRKSVMLSKGAMPSPLDDNNNGGGGNKDGVINLDITKHKRQIVEILDKKMEEKGSYQNLEKGTPSAIDNQLMATMTGLEAGSIKTIPNHIASILLNENKINIVQ